MGIVKCRSIVGTITCYGNHLATLLEHRHQSLLIGRTGTAHHSDILRPFVSLFIRKCLPLFARNHLLVERGHGAIRSDILRFIFEDTNLLAYLQGGGGRITRNHLHLDTRMTALLHGSRNIRTDRIGNGSNGLQLKVVGIEKRYHFGSRGSGTSVAKEASDMTLLDDSFKSIANAVMWGRSLYRNLQRFLFFQLVVNVAALLLVLGGSVIGTEMPLTVTQILWVNLIMDTFAALALASLPPSHEVMKEKPRKASDFIINKSIGFGILFCGIVFFLVMFALLVYCERRGKGGVDVHELTMFFTTFVMIQFWNLFNAKALMSHHTAFRHFLKDKGMILVLVLVLVGQWIIVTFGGEMFRTTPLSLHEWLLIIGSTSVVLWVGELWRAFKRMIAKRR